MRNFEVGERALWRNFPKVIRNDDLGTLMQVPRVSPRPSKVTQMKL